MGHTDHTTTTRHVEWRKWMVLVATIWIQAFTGTNFNFPSYSSELKSVLEITQVELNYLSMASDFGKLFGWCSGVLLLCFPTWVVVFMAAFLGLFGYGLQWLLVQRLVSLPYLMAFILCLSAGCSITWFNTVCFVLCIKNFPNNWPLAVSLSLSFNSITAPLYNLIATNITLNKKINTSSYLILNAFIPFITSIATLVPILQQPCPQTNLQINNTPNKYDAHTFLYLYISAAVTGLYLFFLDTLSQNIFVVGILLLVLPFVIPKFVNGLKRVQNVEGPCYNLIEINNYSDLLEERSSSIGAFNMLLEKDRLTELGEEHSAWMLVARCDFWIYYIAYFCGGTIGLVYSNNLGQICQSLGYGLEITEELVSIYSTCSFFGRLISAVPDLSSCFYTPQMNTSIKFISPHIYAITIELIMFKLQTTELSLKYAEKYTTRTGWLALSLVPMPVAFLVLVLSDTKASLLAATGLIGISSGFIFSAAVSITTDLFGSKSLGINHNILITNIPLGSLLYGVLGGVIYDNNINSSNETVFVGGSRVCMGPKCYNETFRLWGCVSLLGLGSSFLLFARTKIAYQEYYHRRNLISDETACNL